MKKSAIEWKIFGAIFALVYAENVDAAPSVSRSSSVIDAEMSEYGESSETSSEKRKRADFEEDTDDQSASKKSRIFYESDKESSILTPEEQGYVRTRDVVLSIIDSNYRDDNGDVVTV